MVMTNEQFLRVIGGQLAVESQLAVGKALGVSQVAVSRWLTGERKPSKTVILLAERLWCGPREMAAGLPEAKSERNSS